MSKLDGEFSLTKDFIKELGTTPKHNYLVRIDKAIEAFERTLLSLKMRNLKLRQENRELRNEVSYYIKERENHAKL